MKYTWTLSGHKTETSEAEPPREKIVLESRSGESDRHIALKVLAYALFSREAAPLPLRIELSVNQRHKPDLAALDLEREGRVLWWIDCGQIETKRLGRIVRQNRHARVIVVKPTDREALFYARAALPFLPDDTSSRERTEFVGFGHDFLFEFLEAMRGANTLEIALSNPPGSDTRHIALNGREWTAAVLRFPATMTAKVSPLS